MKDELKRLIEDAEARANAPVAASWVIPDPVYADFRQHKADNAALCAAVRELDAERTRMLEAISPLVVDWRGLAATSSGVNSDDYRAGFRTCAKALAKLLPPDPTGS
jgi:hypothetical protein